LYVFFAGRQGEEMSRLSEQSEINGMVLLNRFVRSATWEGMAAEDGNATPRLIEEMTTLAQGGVGLIIKGYGGERRILCDQRA
jgi:2,4-dienoyl-CoA reductase-like NADH-dependent reductase (Old Yellow Enzyme family)